MLPGGIVSLQDRFLICKCTECGEKDLGDICVGLAVLYILSAKDFCKLVTPGNGWLTSVPHGNEVFAATNSSSESH